MSFSGAATRSTPQSASSSKARLSVAAARFGGCGTVFSP